ncbi:hypothetical protein EVAR_18199_1 [Eumeta japonica]|uniref:Uncharacterized protein n=1 Tax=Eumeta variegata TaxID=151549 RepID=A0A4C1UVY8_EUMVA|nr:hypothetical protein EVAR_18199_1 [Eumeta japonica]
MKPASKRLGVLNRARGYVESDHRLLIYKAQLYSPRDREIRNPDLDLDPKPDLNFDSRLKCLDHTRTSFRGPLYSVAWRRDSATTAARNPIFNVKLKL